MPRILGRIGWSLSGAVALGLIVALAGAIYAGPLDPPKPPASTQSNLIYQPASCADYPIVLSTTGSYTLAENLTGCAGKNGIEISANNVTLDLGGFSIVSAGGDGIKSTAGCGSCEVRNGIVTQAGAAGINMATSNGARVTNVHVATIGLEGIILGAFTTLDNCTVLTVGLSAVRNGVEAPGLGSAISDCEIAGASGHGVRLGSRGTLRDCVVSANGQMGVLISGSESLVTGCNVTRNGQQGIVADGALNKIIRNDLASNATPFGGGCADIWARGVGSTGTIIDSNTAENPGGCPIYIEGAGTVVTRNIARNGGAGGDYVVLCACDVGTITAASAATNPFGNIGD